MGLRLVVAVAQVRGVSIDISERKRFEIERQELRDELAHAGRVNLLGQLVSSLAHELGQPLGAILRNAEAAEMILAKTSPDLKELREIVSDISRDDQRASDVINRLRTLLQRRNLELAPVAIGSLLSEVVSLVKFDALARRVSLTINVNSDLPSALGDRVQLQQVLLNLIMNALDAIESGENRSDPKGAIRAYMNEAGMIEVSVSDNGPHYNTWPDAGTTPFRGEKNSNWEGAFRVPCFVKWPGKFPAGVTLNGIVSHEDWLPTFAAVAGAPDIKEKLLKGGVSLNGRTYKNHIDGYNLLDYLSGKTEQSPRKEFIYLNDGAEIVAIRVGDWKATYLENRAEKLDVWREPFVHLRLPLLFNLRRDPFEKSQHNSNTYHDWMIDRAFVLVPLQAVASKFLMTLQEFPPSQQPGDWSLESLEKQVKQMTTAGE
ncbi:MAG: sulfatase-like hydrolase/transferase [Pirellula sp.]